MSLRVLASLLAAAGLLGSMPLWWWWQQQQGPANSTVAPVQQGPSESTPPEPGAIPAEPAPGTPSIEAPAPAETPSPAATAEPERPDRPRPELVTGPDPGRSPLADRLNAPDGSIELDLAILHKVLANYLLELDAHPVGSNREITAQLSGRNARRHAPLPRDLPAISADGELVDRWGTPFFFHALSARETEIRSAGPDRELYTSDDALWTPGSR